MGSEAKRSRPSCWSSSARLSSWRLHLPGTGFRLPVPSSSQHRFPRYCCFLAILRDPSVPLCCRPRWRITRSPVPVLAASGRSSQCARAAAGPAPGTGGVTEEVPKAGPGGGPPPDSKCGVVEAAHRPLLLRGARGEGREPGSRSCTGIRCGCLHDPDALFIVVTPLPSPAGLRATPLSLRMKRASSTNLSPPVEKFPGRHPGCRCVLGAGPGPRPGATR